MTEPEAPPTPDIGGALETAARDAVSAQIAAQARTLAKEELAEVMTPQAEQAMRDAARAEAEAALAPQEEETPEPDLIYSTVEKFVASYVIELYRREVHSFGETQVRWCPQWWEHGEAVARLEALWRAWEQLRHGKGVEPSQWWTHHCDPHMDRLLDPQGPFKYCSPRDGHASTLQPLGSAPAPEGTFVPGRYETTASGLVVPSAGTTPRPQREIVWEFP